MSVEHADHTAYFEGLNGKLLAAVPEHAQRVLELGCANGRLGQAYKATHPGVQWTGVDIAAGPLEVAATRLDRVVLCDVADGDLGALGDGYDTIVIGDLLEHLRDPVGLLRAIHERSTVDARLICCFPNMSHISVLERLLASDLCYDANGLLDATHVRFLSLASSFKMLLDAGWLPNLRDHYAVGHPNRAFLDGLLGAAASLGIPKNTAARNLLIYQCIVDCTKSATVDVRRGARFAVVVPVTNAQQLNLNVVRSPGLAEVGAELIPIEGARSAAEGFERGCRLARAPWVLYCHQDVYLPAGSGFKLEAALAEVHGDLADRSVVGFAGLAVDASGATRRAGLVIDRTLRFDYGAALGAASLDEFAIAMTRTTQHRIDPALAWHLWATDLCLASGMRAARIIRVPIFHNSYNDGVLPEAFRAAAQILLAKYPAAPMIPTLCGNLSRAA